MRTARRTILLLSTALLLAACGSDGDNGMTPGVEHTDTLVATASLDGFVTSTGTADVNGGGPAVGDLDGVTQGLNARQFYSFDLSGIASQATVVDATVRLFQARVIGTPYASHGEVVLDHVDYGSSLDVGDFGGGTLTAAIAVLATQPDTAYHAADVSGEVQADLEAGRSRTQYRLRFSLQGSDGDMANDIVVFSDSEESAGAGAPPQLIITYRQ
jgi:hypothetical protein